MSEHEQAPVTRVPEPPERTPLKSFAALFLGVLSLVYLVNPTAGLFELLPDNLPFVGNLDEATATAVLLGSLSYFGINLPFLRRK